MKIFIFLFVILQYGQGFAERVVVKGVLMCGSKPYQGALVKLVEKDPIKDDLMGKMTTGNDGTFLLDGQASDPIGTIEPVLKIYHDCDDTVLGVPVPCQRRWAMPLPKSAVQSSSTKNPKEFDIGTYNLELRQKGEDHDCIH